MPRADLVLIGLTGPAGCGKDTVARYLSQPHMGFEPYAFADPLRDMLMALLSPACIAPQYMTDRALKEQPIPGIGCSARRLMQTLGTEWGRNLVSPDLWVNLAGLTLGISDDPSMLPVADRIVISDVRFPNEAAWIRKHGGVVLRVMRDSQPVAAHESEQHFAAFSTADVIDNSGPLIELHERVDEVLERLEIGTVTA
jgi:hypothetical protein